MCEGAPSSVCASRVWAQLALDVPELAATYTNTGAYAFGGAS